MASFMTAEDEGSLGGAARKRIRSIIVSSAGLRSRLGSLYRIYAEKRKG